jgi:MoaA/NifB/PqqE/SkfB family radical SAM enzyme
VKGSREQMLDQVAEFMWIPTMRCNCHCTHCRVHFDDKDEIGATEVAQALCESKYISPDVVVSITGGGEPFLRDDLAKFVLPVLRRFRNCHIHFTTNGICYKEISEFVSQIPKQDRGRIHFAVSIDGLEDTHNRIRNHSNAYSLALASVEHLSQSGFSIGINTVIHPENIAQFSELENKIQAHCDGNANCVFIPNWTDVAMGNAFPYTDEEAKRLFPYVLQHKLHTKYICSSGLMNAGICHAGEDNVFILPSGKLYVCYAGIMYRNDAERFYIGDLCEGFDFAWIQRRKSGVFEHVQNCVLCNNYCDIDREHRRFGFSYLLTKEETEKWFFYTDEQAYYGDGWH